MRVTDSGTLRRFEEEELLSTGVSLSPRGRRGSDPVLSDVDRSWLLADALFSPNEGRDLISRRFAAMLNMSEEWKFWRNFLLPAQIV